MVRKAAARPRRFITASPTPSAGSTSLKIYRKYQLARTGRDAVGLPSTSPANAAWTLEKLYAVWKQIAE